MSKKVKISKEKTIKNIIAELTACKSHSFSIENLDQLLAHGEILNTLGDNLLDADQKNPLAQTLKETLNDALYDLRGARENEEYVLSTMNHISENINTDEIAMEEKERDMATAEGYAASMLDKAEFSYEQSLDQASVIDAEYAKKNSLQKAE